MASVRKSVYVNVRYDSPAKLIGRFVPELLLADRFVTPLWYAVGILGSLLSYQVWTNRVVRRRSSIALLLAALALSDLTYLLLHLVDELKRAWDIELRDVRALCESYFILFHMMQSLSPLLLLAISVDLCVCACKPIKSMQRPHRSSARTAVYVLVALAFAANIANGSFRSYDYETQQCNTDDLPPDRSARGVYFWSRKLVFFGAVPVVSLLLCLAAIRTIKGLHFKASLRPQCDVTIDLLRHHPSKIGFSMLITMVLLSVLLTLPSTVTFCLQVLAPPGNLIFDDEEVEFDVTWQRYFLFRIVDSVASEAALAACATRVLVFLLNKRFRKCAKSVMRRATCKPRKAVYDCSAANGSQQGAQAQAGLFGASVFDGLQPEATCPTTSFSTFVRPSVTDVIASYV